MNLTFRPIRDGDVETVIELWRRCNLLVPHNDPHRDIASARATASADVLVGEMLGRIIATAMVGYDGHRGWVYYVAVDPDRRRERLGARVMDEVAAWMKARGVPKAELMIRTSNSQVQDFYSTVGWGSEPVTVMAKRMDDDAPPIGLGTVDTHVTALQMLSRPTRPAPHPPAGVRTALIRAEPPTVAFYRFLYNRVGADWTWVARRLDDDAKLEAEITDPKVEIYVLYVDGSPAGYGELDRRPGGGNVELAYFGLMPEFIGRGVGRFLLDTVVDIAWTGNTERLWVHTCDLDHPRALGVYQKAGFEPFDQWMETLPDPRLVGLPLPVRVADHPAGGGDAVVTPLHANVTKLGSRRPET